MKEMSWEISAAVPAYLKDGTLANLFWCPSSL